jgi:outer membrane lipopolysaccharide assembly protein LptE/RlpB
MVFEKLRILCLSLALALILCGCGVYSFSGSMSSGIESVAVPVFENESVEYGIAENLTTVVIEVLVADNSLKVVTRSKADAVLEGDIIRYHRSAYTYDENDQVQEYKVDITTKVRLNKSDGSLVWEEEALSGYGIYNAADETEEEGKSRAIAKIAADIVNRTVRDW